MFQSAKEKTQALLQDKVVPAVALAIAGMGSAYATTAEDITGAYTLGETNLGLAVSGLIGMAAVVTGIGFIISLLRK